MCYCSYCKDWYGTHYFLIVCILRNALMKLDFMACHRTTSMYDAWFDIMSSVLAIILYPHLSRWSFLARGFSLRFVFSLYKPGIVVRLQIYDLTERCSNQSSRSLIKQIIHYRHARTPLKRVTMKQYSFTYQWTLWSMLFCISIH